MRHGLLILALVVAAALAACKASASGPTPIVFGITGGSAIPYHVTIQPNGIVRASGRKVRRQILPRQVRRLRREIENAHLTSRICAGTLPDFAIRYIRLDGRTVKVHGACEPRFTRVFADLQAAVKRRG